MDLTDVESFCMVFKLMWTIISKDLSGRCRLNILDTICFKHGRPNCWLFTSEKDGEVYKKNNARLNTDEIIQGFRKRGKLLRGKKAPQYADKVATIYFYDSIRTVSSCLIDERELEMYLERDPQQCTEIIAIQLYVGGMDITGCGLFEHNVHLKSVPCADNIYKNEDVMHTETFEVSHFGHDFHLTHSLDAFYKGLKSTTNLGRDRVHQHAKEKIAITSAHHNLLDSVSSRICYYVEAYSLCKVRQASFHFIFNSSWVPFLCFGRSVALKDPIPMSTAVRRDYLFFFDDAPPMLRYDNDYALEIQEESDRQVNFMTNFDARETENTLLDVLSGGDSPNNKTDRKMFKKPDDDIFTPGEGEPQLGTHDEVLKKMYGIEAPYIGKRVSNIRYTDNFEFANIPKVKKAVQVVTKKKSKVSFQQKSAEELLFDALAFRGGTRSEAFLTTITAKKPTHDKDPVVEPVFVPAYMRSTESSLLFSKTGPKEEIKTFEEMKQGTSEDIKRRTMEKLNARVKKNSMIKDIYSKKTRPLSAPAARTSQHNPFYDPERSNKLATSAHGFCQGCYCSMFSEMGENVFSSGVNLGLVRGKNHSEVKDTGEKSAELMKSSGEVAEVEENNELMDSVFYEKEKGDLRSLDCPHTIGLRSILLASYEVKYLIFMKKIGKIASKDEFSYSTALREETEYVRGMKEIIKKQSFTSNNESSFDKPIMNYIPTLADLNTITTTAVSEYLFKNVRDDIALLQARQEKTEKDQVLTISAKDHIHEVLQECQDQAMQWAQSNLMRANENNQASVENMAQSNLQKRSAMLHSNDFKTVLNRQVDATQNAINNIEKNLSNSITTQKLEAFESKEALSSESIKAAYYRLIYDNVLKQQNCTRLYSSVPVCKLCFKYYSLLDFHRDVLILKLNDDIERTLAQPLFQPFPKIKTERPFSHHAATGTLQRLQIEGAKEKPKSANFAHRDVRTNQQWVRGAADTDMTKPFPSEMHSTIPRKILGNSYVAKPGARLMENSAITGSTVFDEDSGVGFGLVDGNYSFIYLPKEEQEDEFIVSDDESNDDLEEKIKEIESRRKTIVRETLPPVDNANVPNEEVLSADEMQDTFDQEPLDKEKVSVHAQKLLKRLDINSYVQCRGRSSMLQKDKMLKKPINSANNTQNKSFLSNSEILKEKTTLEAPTQQFISVKSLGKAGSNCLSTWARLLTDPLKPIDKKTYAKLDPISPTKKKAQALLQSQIKHEARNFKGNRNNRSKATEKVERKMNFSSKDPQYSENYDTGNELIDYGYQNVYNSSGPLPVARNMDVIEEEVPEGEEYGGDDTYSDYNEIVMKTLNSLTPAPHFAIPE